MLFLNAMLLLAEVFGVLHKILLDLASVCICASGCDCADVLGRGEWSLLARSHHLGMPAIVLTDEAVVTLFVLWR